LTARIYKIILNEEMGPSNDKGTKEFKDSKSRGYDDDDA
jgi:hypothetical protein